MPKVSIVIPAYNAAKHLPDALYSLLGQTFKDFEIIVVDDGSTDNTKEVALSFGSDKIKYIFQKHSGAPSLPRNTGIKESGSQYLSFFDSDDIMVSDKLESAIRFLDSEPQLGLVFTDFIKFDEVQGYYPDKFLDNYDVFGDIKKKSIGDNCYVLGGQDAYEALFYENYIGTSGVVIPKNVLTNTGIFDENLQYAEDWDLWSRITKLYDIGYIDIVGHYYRVHSGSLSSTRSKKLAENRVKAFRKQLESNLNTSILRQTKKLISKNLTGIGCQFQEDGNMRRARSYYFLSLKEYFSYRAIRNIIITFLPARLFSYLKIIRGRR